MVILSCTVGFLLDPIRYHEVVGPFGHLMHRGMLPKVKSISTDVNMSVNSREIAKI